MRVRAVVVVTVVATLVSSSAALAAPKRVTLLAADDGSDERLINATTATLAPWDIELETSAVASPGDRLPDAATGARSLAEQFEADAVVWLTDGREDGPEGVSVWVYDRRHDNVIARSIAVVRPFDRPGAAAVGLTIKTLLRHSEAAPTARRFGSGTDGDGRLRLSAAASLRARPGSDGDVEPRLSIALWWRLPLLGDQLEAYLRFSSGPGTSINREAEGFVGRHADNSASAGISYYIPLGDRFAIRPGVGATVEAATLEGILSQPNAQTEVSRINPSIDGSVAGILTVGQVQFALRVEGSYVFRRQEFLVDGESVFALSSSDIETAFLVTVPLY